MTRTLPLVPLALAALLAACGGGDDAPPADATRPSPQLRMTITATEAFPGSHGSVGAYERVAGTIGGEVDPRDPRNRIIQDLDLAPVNARGLVEHSTDFVTLRPKDLSKANGVLRYDAPTRGSRSRRPTGRSRTATPRRTRSRGRRTGRACA